MRCSCPLPSAQESSMPRFWQRTSGSAQLLLRARDSSHPLASFQFNLLPQSVRPSCDFFHSLGLVEFSALLRMTKTSRDLKTASYALESTLAKAGPGEEGSGSPLHIIVSQHPPPPHHFILHLYSPAVRQGAHHSMSVLFLCLTGPCNELCSLRVGTSS